MPCPVAVEDAAKDDDSDDAPHGEYEIRLGRQGVGYPEVRHEEIDHEGGGHDRASDATRHDEGAALLPRHGERAERHVSVGNARADDRDIDYPADGCPAHERNEARDGDYRDYRVSRASVAVKPAERGAEHSVARHRIDEAARRYDMPDEPRHNGGERREAEDDDPRSAKSLLYGVKHGNRLNAVEYAARRHVVAPVGEARRMNRSRGKRKRRVGRSRRDERRDDDADRPPTRERELLGGMRDRLEPDERPRRKHDDCEYLGDRRLPVGERRGEARDSAMVLHENRGDAYRYADREDNRESDLEPRDDPLAAKENAADNEKRGYGGEYLARIDVVAGYMVAEAEAEKPAKDMPTYERERGGVGPRDCDVGEDQEPSADVAVVSAAYALHVSVCAARLREFLYEIVVVPADEKHDHRADAEAD